MKALTYIEHNHFALLEKPEPEIIDPRDAVVRVTLGSICTSDLHIKHGSVPRAVPGITVGHEMVGVVDPAIKERIDALHRASRFKFQTLPVYHNGLPMALTDETDYYN